MTQIKIASFNNLVICKYKLKEFESVVSITEQVLEMDSGNAKGLFFRGKAFLETQEYDKGVECF